MDTRDFFFFLNTKSMVGGGLAQFFLEKKKILPPIIQTNLATCVVKSKHFNSSSSCLSLHSLQVSSICFLIQSLITLFFDLYPKNSSFFLPFNESTRISIT